MLTTKSPKATVGGLSPSKGYTLQIFQLTGSGNVLLARREFVSKSPIFHMEFQPLAGECVRRLELSPAGTSGLGALRRNSAPSCSCPRGLLRAPAAPASFPGTGGAQGVPL